MNKRGQGLSTNAIILIVLGVLILVFLIIGFSIGWKKIFPWIKPSNNVDEIKQQCELACNTNSKHNFCTVNRTLFAEGGVELKDINCNFLSIIYTEYGIAKCASIKCDAEVFTDQDESINWCDAEMARLNNAQKIRFCDNIKVQYPVDNALETKTCREAAATTCPKV